MPDDQTVPMDVDEVECPGYDYVIVYLDGRRECYNGNPDHSGLDSWTENGRYLIEGTGMPAAPTGGAAGDGG